MAGSLHRLTKPLVVAADANQLIPHPNYQPNSNAYDIGLIILNKDITGVPFPTLAQPKDDIPTSFDDYKYKQGDVITAVGWGCTSLIPSPTIVEVSIDILQKIYLPISSSDSSVGGTFFLGYNDANSLKYTLCHGDSGGPAFYKKNNDLYLIGIHAAGSSGEQIGPSLETKVSSYYGWITDQINLYAPSPTSQPSSPRKINMR